MSKRAVRIHMGESKMCKGGEYQRITVMTRPGDVIAGGSGGMGPCPPPQHQVYTCHIPRIYLVYANKNGIYQVYAWYILMGKSIYQVYTWYIPCINLSYDNVKYIPDIYHKKLSETFRYLSRDSLDPPYTKYKLGINLVYDIYSSSILHIYY